MSGMLGSVLRSGQATVEIVDLEPGAICSRIEALGGPTRDSGRLTHIYGNDCVEKYVDALAERASGQVVQELKDVVPSESRQYPDPVSVTWRHAGAAAVRAVSKIVNADDGTVILVCEGDPLFNVVKGGLSQRAT